MAPSHALGCGEDVNAVGHSSLDHRVLGMPSPGPRKDPIFVRRKHRKSHLSSIANSTDAQDAVSLMNQFLEGTTGFACEYRHLLFRCVVSD